MRVVGWCALHGKMVDRAKLNSKCHRAGESRCKHFSFKIPKKLKQHKRRVEGHGEFRSYNKWNGGGDWT